MSSKELRVPPSNKLQEAEEEAFFCLSDDDDDDDVCEGENDEDEGEEEEERDCRKRHAGITHVNSWELQSHPARL